jgi:hypothetical protein
MANEGDVAARAEDGPEERRLPARKTLARRAWDWLWPANYLAVALLGFCIATLLASLLSASVKKLIGHRLALNVSLGEVFLLIAVPLATIVSIALRAGYCWAERSLGVGRGPRWRFGGETVPGKEWEFNCACSDLLHDSGILLGDPGASCGRSHFCEGKVGRRWVHTFGPYLELPRGGVYMATFWLRIGGDHLPDDALRLRLQAYCSRKANGADPRVICELPISASTGYRFEAFAMRYQVHPELVEGYLHEWRIIPAPGVGVWLDKITIKFRGG